MKLTEKYILSELRKFSIESKDYGLVISERNAERFAEDLVKNCSIPDVVGRSEQLVGFLRQYQKACEIMHVNKIDAKNFVELYKTN